MAKHPVRNLEANEQLIGPEDGEITLPPAAPDTSAIIGVTEPPALDRHTLVWRIAIRLGYKIAPHVENGKPIPQYDANHPADVVFDGRFPEWDIYTPDGLILGYRIPQSEVAAQFPDWLNDPHAALSLELDKTGDRMWVVMRKSDNDWWVAIRDDDGEMSQTYGKASHTHLATGAVLAWLEME